jgi:hypothetical protein
MPHARVDVMEVALPLSLIRSCALTTTSRVLGVLCTGIKLGPATSLPLMQLAQCYRHFERCTQQLYSLAVRYLALSR